MLQMTTPTTIELIEMLLNRLNQNKGLIDANTFARFETMIRDFYTGRELIGDGTGEFCSEGIDMVNSAMWIKEELEETLSEEILSMPVFKMLLDL